MPPSQTLNRETSSKTLSQSNAAEEALPDFIAQSTLDALDFEPTPVLIPAVTPHVGQLSRSVDHYTKSSKNLPVHPNLAKTSTSETPALRPFDLDDNQSFEPYLKGSGHRNLDRVGKHTLGKSAHIFDQPMGLRQGSSSSASRQQAQEETLQSSCIQLDCFPVE